MMNEEAIGPRPLLNERWILRQSGSTSESVSAHLAKPFQSWPHDRFSAKQEDLIQIGKTISG